MAVYAVACGLGLVGAGGMVGFGYLNEAERLQRMGKHLAKYAREDYGIKGREKIVNHLIGCNLKRRGIMDDRAMFPAVVFLLAGTTFEIASHRLGPITLATIVLGGPIWLTSIGENMAYRNRLAIFLQGVAEEE